VAAILLLSPARLTRLALITLVILAAQPARGQPDRRPPPVQVTLPSERPSGNPVVDRIWVTYYAAEGSTASPCPAVVLLHPLGTRRLKQMKQFARFLSARGIGAAIMTLPYHMRRLPPGEVPGRRFVERDVAGEVQALDQSAADTSTVATWLREQPTVDPERVGTVGVSLGAIVAHLAMGRDEDFSAGVALLGGGDLVYLRRRSLVFNFPEPADRISRAEAELVRQVDPLTYADRNRPRNVLMVQAARDIVVPAHCGRELWKALGRPPIRWVDTGHAGLFLGAGGAKRATSSFLRSAWKGAGGEPRAGLLDGPPGAEAPSRLPAPKVWAPTLKLGMVFGLDSIVTPALEWQAYSFLRRRDHMSLLHADVGWSGRGPFFGLAATLNAYMDFGVGHRWGGDPIRPYGSLHLVF
jgi:dienelactone hydrolase